MMWLLLIVVIIPVLYLFLIAPRMVGKPDCSVLYGVHYAHRGLFDNETDAPENSLNAMRKAIKAGCGIELDVQLSKDDIPIVFHDASLKRMCGVDGNVWEYTLQELRKMRLCGTNQGIPTLNEVLKVIDGQVPLIIEYKMDRVDTKVCGLGNAILEKYKGTYCIESFHPLAVQWYRKYRPDVIRGQLSANYARDGKKGLHLKIMTYLLTNFLTRPDFIAYKHRDRDNLSRCICKKLGAVSVAWTIKNREQYEKAKEDFDLFIFDSCIL